MVAVSRLANDWDTVARKNAFRAVMDTTWNGGPQTEEEFFQTGEDDFARLGALALRLGFPIEHETRVLDFGCGIGRVARSIAKVSRHVTGLDVSQEMVARAREYPGMAGLGYHHCLDVDLRAIADSSYDLVLSVLTFQHIPPRSLPSIWEVLSE